MPIKPPHFTHYAYYESPRENRDDPIGKREPDGLLCLEGKTLAQRREIRDRLFSRGQFLAKLPHPFETVESLRKYLRDNGR